MSEFEKYFANYHSNNEAHAETIARDAWNARQEGIDQLKAEKERLERKLRWSEALRNNQFEHLLEMKSQSDRVVGFQNLVKSLRSEFDLNGGSDQVERQIELLEEVVRGQAKPQKPKLGKTAIGDCLHFGTTMFRDGKATCFGCDAVVNHERKVIGVILRGEHE